MATGQLNHVIRHLRRSALLQDGGGMTDSKLLECFINQRDEVAFEALLRRHGPMVFSLCQRVLRNAHDAEDAFQATFLVLARKAASIRQRELLGNWLYGVAYRAALEAKTATRRRRERQVSVMPEPQAVAEDDSWIELRPILDQELSRLPDKYRVPIVLCDLEGRTRREVARQLGIPDGTLSGRLTTARRILAKRLARHGFALSGGALAAMLTQNSASAALPTSVVGSTIKAATLVAAGQAAATGMVSVNVAALTEGVLKTMFLTKLKIATAVLLIAVASLFGAGALIDLTLAADQPKARGATEKAGNENQPTAAKKDESPSPGEPSNNKPKKEPEPLKITAGRLAQDFLANQADADERFVVKYLEVTGTLVQVFRAPTGFESKTGVRDYVVELSFNEKKPGEMPLQFMFAESAKKQLVGLKPKQAVTIRAYCGGLVPGMGIITPEGTKKGTSLHFWYSKIVAAE